MIPTANVPRLLDLAYAAYNRALLPLSNPASWAPVFDDNKNLLKSFCNLAVNYVCTGFLYVEFNGMNANQMIEHMKANPAVWIVQDEANAQDRANHGVLVIAGWENPLMNEHGHVNLIVPGFLQGSGEAGIQLPKCMNVGKDVFFGKELAYAFAYPSEKPTLYALAGMIP